GARRALHLLAEVNLWLIVLGVALETCSILSYAHLTRAMIHAPPPPSLPLLRTTLSTLAVSHVVPGGAAVGGALGFRLLTRFGLSGTDAAFAIAAQGIGSGGGRGARFPAADQVRAVRHGRRLRHRRPGHRLGGGAEPPAVGGVAGVHPR